MEKRAAKKQTKKPAFPMQEVESKAVKAIGHQGGKLRVHYRSSGKVYEFAGVTADQYEKLRGEKSLGVALQALVKSIGKPGVIVNEK